MDSTATIALVLTAKDMASKEINRVNSSLKGLKSGGLAGLPLGFMGVAGAAAAATGALVAGIQGAIEEQAAIQKLDAVLKANVPSWDGNTAAIDEATKAAQRKAFTDDDVRASLTKLVPVTKDVNKALALQQTAMDLARLKGIDLAEASQALVDIDGGRYRALGKLIGSTKEITTETQALAEVQRVAQGQAEAYMDTTAGKSAALTDKWNELTESAGTLVLEGLEPVIDNLLLIGNAIDDVNGKSVPKISEMGESLWNDLTKPTYDAAKAWDTLTEKNAAARAQLKLTNKTLEATETGADGATDSISNLAKAFGGLVPDRWAFSVTFDRSAGKRQQQQNENKPKKKPKKKTADGGWVGWDGPETILAGERGPEYVVPAHAIRQASPQPAGVTIQGVSERELMDMVDRQLYFKLRRAGTAS
jgi:hypothetical protein